MKTTEILMITAITAVFAISLVSPAAADSLVGPTSVTVPVVAADGSNSSTPFLLVKGSFGGGGWGGHMGYGRGGYSRGYYPYYGYSDDSDYGRYCYWNGYRYVCHHRRYRYYDQ